MPDNVSPCVQSGDEKEANAAQWRTWAMQQSVSLVATRAVGAGQLEETAERILRWTYSKALRVD